MATSQFSLLGTRRFLPLFVTQFLGAFNDNVFRNALVVAITFVLADQAGLNAQITVTFAFGIFILPFFLFSAIAGQLADKFDKSRLIRVIKFAEILVMAGAALSFYLQSIPLLMGVLFLMGTQSAFFGPVKYGILPDQLAENELIGGNGLIEAGTFLAILTGTILGGLAILTDGVITQRNLYTISAILLGIAGTGWLASLFIPASPRAVPDLRVNPNFLAETGKIMRYMAGQRSVFLSILGISWFWLVGATFLAQFPTFAKDVVGGDNSVFTLFLTLFSVGIGIGSLACNKLLNGRVHATYVPLGALGMSVFIVDLYFASQRIPLAGSELSGALAFVTAPGGWRVVTDLVLIAVFGGIYIVPLYAILQHHSDARHRARNIAANSIMNALFMVVSAIYASALLAGGVEVPAIFLTLAVMNAVVAVYIARLLPGALARAIVSALLRLFYRVDVTGTNNFNDAGDRLLIVANHQSFLDAMLIAAFVPEPLTFAVNTHIARNRMFQFFLSLAETHELDPTNALSMRALIQRIDEGRKVVIFPEGRITVTGALMKVYEGPGMIADKASAQIMPVRLEGAQYTPFSRLRGKVRIRMFPQITLRFMAPRRFDIPDGLSSRKRREVAGNQLHDLMTSMVFESSPYRQTLFQSLLDAARLHGRDHPVVEDINRQPMNYGRLLAGAFVLGRKLAKRSRPGERVGVLLPNTAATTATFFALHAFARVPAMLNFSTGARNAALACRMAEVRTVVTSRRFIETAELEDMVKEIEQAGVDIVHLEDVRRRIFLPHRLKGLLMSYMPRLCYALTDRARDPEAPAVVLFTSGTEGAPKGVVLSHVNIQANRYQVSSIIDFGPADIVFNVLPMFHSFGLTAGTILPLLAGIKAFVYPSPLHYRIIPELIYDTNATIIFGTDTFLAGYARYAHPYDFYSLRYVFAGAEKLKDQTRRDWSDRFGVRILEGYGATETAPVLSLNTPMQNRAGSVGRLIPGVRHRIEPVPGIAEGGKLVVSGPNVMSGYLKIDQPGVLVPPPDGWYDTGDIVTIDEHGFVFIQGRAKRFAKIGGEMVSLAAVENYLAALWPAHAHAVVNIPDPKKGEQLVVVTNNRDAARDALIAYAKTQGIAEIAIPKTILTVDEVPLLGTGKTDYVGVRALVESTFN